MWFYTRTVVSDAAYFNLKWRRPFDYPYAPAISCRLFRPSMKLPLSFTCQRRALMGMTLTIKGLSFPLELVAALPLYKRNLPLRC
jgi:hypothetical protein